MIKIFLLAKFLTPGTGRGDGVKLKIDLSNSLEKKEIILKRISPKFKILNRDRGCGIRKIRKVKLHQTSGEASIS